MRSLVKLAMAMIMVIGIALSAAACSTGNSTTSNGSIQITDQLGRTVTLNGTPQRIISLAPANTEILFALGLGDKVVGDTDYCNYPTEAQNVSKVGGFSTPSIEKIVELEPDIVFAAPIHEAITIPQLENLEIKVIALAPTTINETYDAIELVGNVTGVQKAADTLIKNMRTRIGAVTSLVANLSDKEKQNVFYIVWVANGLFTTAGGDTLPSQLIKLAGGKNIFDNLTGYPQPEGNLEAVLDRNPDIIIASTGMGSGADAPLNWALNESSLQVTNASKEGKIFSINTDLTGRFGPRIVDAVEEMFRLIHPDLATKLK